MKELKIKIKDGKVEIETFNYKGDSCQSDANQVDQQVKKLGVLLTEKKEVKKRDYYEQEKNEILE